MSKFKIIYNCKQATFLVEKKQLEKLGFFEAIGLQLHLFDCSFCRQYGEESQVINTMVNDLVQSSMKTNVRLDDGFKKQLKNRIEEEMSKN